MLFLIFILSRRKKTAADVSDPLTVWLGAVVNVVWIHLHLPPYSVLFSVSDFYLTGPTCKIMLKKEQLPSLINQHRILSLRQVAAR